MPKIFSDDGGASLLTYTFTSSPDASSFLSFSSTDLRFYGIPTLLNAFSYNITLHATDLDRNTGSTSFLLVIDPGDYIFNGIIGVPFFRNMSTTAYFGGNISQMQYAICSSNHTNLQCDFDAVTLTYTGIVALNDYHGWFKIIINGYSSANSLIGTESRNIFMRPNLPPVQAEPVTIFDSCLYTYESYTKAIPLSAILDPENETIDFS